MHKMLATAGFAAYLAFMFSITILLSLGGHPHLNLVPLRTVIGDWRLGGMEFIVNFLGNIVAFMPFGILIPAMSDRPLRWWHVAGTCAAISGVIELGQYLRGSRVADVDDILLNTLGGLAGFAIVLGWRSLHADKSRTLTASVDG